MTGLPFTFTDLAFLSGHGITSWSQRVVANGGALPSISTINAMETCLNGIKAAGLFTKIYSMCVFVPDSLIAATTPLIVNKGGNLWTNNNFVSGDLTIHGLKGNGTTKYLDTTVMAKSGEAINSGKVGLSIIITENSNHVAATDMGHQEVGPEKHLLINVTSTFAVAGQSYFSTQSSGAGQNVVFSDYNGCGWRSFNAVAGSSNQDLRAYGASPNKAHALIGSVNAVATLATASNRTIFAFASNAGGSAAAFSPKRMSAALVHDGLTSAESSALWNLLLTLRTSLGGGTGDEIENWAARVESNGGAAPATGTKTALRTFFQGLISNSLLTKMVTVNCYAPDNLTAARIPLVWTAGLELWTNNNFVSGDLTVNGLKGNTTTKSLVTGIITSTARDAVTNTSGLSNTSAGMSVMLAVVPTSTSNYPNGCGSSAASSHFTLGNFSGTLGYFCWRFDGAAGTNFVQAAAPSPGGTWAGFLSGNRTASNAIAIYRASTANAFATGATGTGSQTGAAIGTNALTAHAFNTVGGIQLWSDNTISFFAMHSGLNSTESQNLYNLVAAMRTSLGGGNP